MIEIVKEKPIKSTTSVEGILVQVTGGQWYGITIFRPARNPWLGRASKSTTTGRTEFTVGSETFQMQFKDKPNFEELKETLVNVLNGAEPVKCKIAY
uniref:Uncharacterized protein n=1 Tax=Virus NIOZ-UU157 TaxID=2763269 RepID=A0A7S9STZ6_9VIRU|nr:MAG: hypothetical protein NIOZUU157_00118 [Virus NIOZ-UU157]